MPRAVWVNALHYVEEKYAYISNTAGQLSYDMMEKLQLIIFNEE